MFDINYIELFKSIPPELAVFIISMLPISELRGAIPVGLTIYNLDIILNLIIAIVGNLIPMFFILYLIDPVSKILMKHSKFFNKFFTWIFKRTVHKFEGKYARYGSIALVLFVAVPLPITGCWTGSLAAFLFQIPKKKSIPLITFGVAIAGIVVTIITLSASNTFKFLLNI